MNHTKDERYKGLVTIDLKHLNKVLEVDSTSQAARIQAGVLGPDMEKQLRSTGLTMRFFLQAWEFSSWAAGSPHARPATTPPTTRRSTTTSRAFAW